MEYGFAADQIAGGLRKIKLLCRNFGTQIFFKKSHFDQKKVSLEKKNDQNDAPIPTSTA